MGSRYSLCFLCVIAFQLPLMWGSPNRSLAVKPATISFQPTIVSGSNTAVVTLSNTGSVNVKVTSAAISGAGFSLIAPSLPTNINSGSSITLKVTFAPTGLGSWQGNLIINSNAVNSPASISLSGTGISPLQITTTSFPQAQVGSPYQAAAQANGGVPPYTWTLVAGSTLASGLSLDSASGTISGQPITAGDTSFSLRVSDSASPPAIDTRSYVISVSGGIETASPIFTWYGSKEQDLSTWTDLTSGHQAVVPDPTGGKMGGGNVIEITYGPTATPGQVDLNRYVGKTITPTSHLYMRWKQTWKTPETDGYPCGQKKLLYLKADSYNDTSWILSSDQNFNETPPNNLQLENVTNGTAPPNRANGSGDQLTNDVTYCIDEEVAFPSTQNAGDGYVNLWVNGVKDLGASATGVTPYNYNLTGKKYFTLVELGRQLDTYNCSAGWALGNFSSVSASQTGNTVTLTVQPSDQHINPVVVGKDIIVSGFANSALNGVFTVTGSTAATVTYTTATSGSLTDVGGNFSLQGHQTVYLTDVEIYSLAANQSSANVPSTAGCR